MRALVVEDDPDVGPDLVRSLKQAGFVVDLARDGEDASQRGCAEDYSVAVLDLGLPRLDGLSVLRQWRAELRAFPVLILSARSDWTEKVQGIEAGADDYLSKPFQMGELVARVRGLVRRAAGLNSSTIAAGSLRLDTRTLTATQDGRPVRLSPLEYRLLDCLAHRPGVAVSAAELAEQLYGVGDSDDVNAIEAIVARLRRKLGAQAILTRRGFGYQLGDDA